MGVTVGTFVITGAIAAVIMFLLVKIFPPVLTPWAEIPSKEMGEYATLSQMIVNFFTAEDFVGLVGDYKGSGINGKDDPAPEG